MIIELHFFVYSIPYVYFVLICLNLCQNEKFKRCKENVVPCTYLELTHDGNIWPLLRLPFPLPFPLRAGRLYQMRWWQFLEGKFRGNIRLLGWKWSRLNPQASGTLWSHSFLVNSLLKVDTFWSNISLIGCKSSNLNIPLSRALPNAKAFPV